jgi:hypothetical protein
MTMSPLFRSSTHPAAAGTMPWLLNLATRVLACSLNMPEPLVHNTGIFMFAQVLAAETRAARTLCPIRLLRRLQNWRRRPRASTPSVLARPIRTAPR